MEAKMIGGKIAEARKKMNISQAELAKRLFISPQAVGKWERGESIPNLITFNRLSEILGVDLNYFSGNFPSTQDEPAPEITGGTNAASEQLTPEDDSLPHGTDHQVRIKLSAADFKESGFAGVTLHKGKFKASALRGADFSGADLTGSSFDISDAHEAIFNGADLTDCRFSLTDLSGAQFNKSILVRTEFNKLALARAKFTGVNLIDVKLNMTDLRETIFVNCTFTGVHFLRSDLQGQCFEGLTFIDVRFDKSALNDVSFKGATLKNVTLTPPFSVTNKQYLAMKTICFDGARMDKLTYIALKGLGVIDLSKVIVM
ncbi:MAG TPA: pentapeptide repeat-containing protein [Ignavibacteriales bacterium]|nr:pentapeptide repeat-containing protein [Ignavibacteriales bacterium]